MALTNGEPWRYFSTVSQVAARAALRVRMGSSYATSPIDADLDAILARSVAFLERYTRRFFVLRVGLIKLSGNDAVRLWMPYPIVSTDQGGTGVTAVTIFDDVIDVAELYFNEGALDGPAEPGDDPRKDPFIERGAGSFYGSLPSRPPLIEVNAAVFAYGVRNVDVTASWGYLEADGTTPELIQHALARLCVYNVAPNDDLCAIDDKKRAALTSESTQGRSYTVSERAISSGLTLDREIDQILRSYRRPPRVTISRAPRRRGASRYYRE